MKEIIKRIITITILTILLLPFAVQTFASIDEIGEKDTYLVMSNVSTIKKIQNTYGGEKSDDCSILTEVELTEKQVNKLERENRSIYIEKDIVLTGDLDNSEDTEYINQWNLEALGIGKNEENHNNKVKIAIIDSGVSFSGDFTLEESKNFIDDDLNENPIFNDASGHGTAMAGIIGAYNNEIGITGINPNAVLYSAKVLDSNNQAPLSRVIEGIYWAIDNKVDIINMSFGTSFDSEILHNAVKDAYNAGILIVASSGNAPESEVKYPAAYDEVIAVGAIGVDGKLWSDTSTGEQLELVAPGEKVETTGLFFGTLVTSGTSISAAQISGVASLLLQKDNTKSPDFIRKLLSASSKKVEYENKSVGLVDYGYACEIYNSFSEKYVEKRMNEIKQNTSISQDFTNITDTIVEGMWGKNDDSTKRGHNKMSNDASTAAGLSKYYMEIVNYACINVDNYYGSATGKSKGVNYTEIGYKIQNLHGRGNYVATIRFLSNFAQYMGQGLKLETALDKCQGKFPILLTKNNSGVYVANNEDGELMIDLVKAVREMYKNLVKTDSKMSLYKYYNTGNIGPSRRMLVFLGVALHVIGDIYSHRTIVPNYTVSNGFSSTLVYDSNNHTDKFYTGDFRPFTSKIVSPELKIELKNYVKPMNPFVNNTKDTYRYPEYFKAAVEMGVVEFQDVISFEYKLSNSKNDLSKCTKYDDRAGFCKERYNNSLQCCKDYLVAIINKNFPNFTDVLKFNVKYIFPTDDYVKLNNFKNYTTAAGLDASKIKNSEWSVHSTSNYV